MESPSKFMLVCDSVSGQFGDTYTAKEMGQAIEDTGTPLRTDLVLSPGILVGYYWKKEGWARAKVESCSNEGVNLRLVDYNEDATARPAQLRQLPNHLLAYPFAAVECMLDAIPMDGMDWDPRAVEYFQRISELSKHVTVTAKFMWRDANVSGVNLLVGNQDMTKVFCSKGWAR